MLIYTSVHYAIKAPRIPKSQPALCQSGGVNLYQVTPNSSWGRRRALEEIAFYFKREFRYDFVQYAADEKCDSRDVGFLWSDELFEHCTNKGNAIGGAVFRWREWTDAAASFGLSWVWMHPYCRGRGILTEAWPYFRERFGQFWVERPLSRAMGAFLEKLNEKSNGQLRTRNEYIVAEANSMRTLPSH